MIFARSYNEMFEALRLHKKVGKEILYKFAFESIPFRLFIYFLNKKKDKEQKIFNKKLENMRYADDEGTIHI